MEVLNGEVSVTEVEVALATLKMGSAPDGITTGALKKIPAVALTYIINNFMRHEVVPPELKRFRTVFIPKVPKPRTASDFRPFIVSPILLRLYSKVLLARFTKDNISILSSLALNWTKGLVPTSFCYKALCCIPRRPTADSMWQA